MKHNKIFQNNAEPRIDMLILHRSKLDIGNTTVSWPKWRVIEGLIAK